MLTKRLMLLLRMLLQYDRPRSRLRDSFPRCFYCNQYGHFASECRRQPSSDQRAKKKN